VFLSVDVAACELKSGAIYPATFPDKGPDEDIRAAGRMAKLTVRCMMFTCMNSTVNHFVLQHAYGIAIGLLHTDIVSNWLHLIKQSFKTLASLGAIIQMRYRKL